MQSPKILKTILNEFIYGGHLPSLGAASIVFVSTILLRLEPSWDILAVAYLVFYVIYLYDRLRGLQTDYLTNPQRTKHIKKYFNFIPIMIILLILIIGFVLLYFSNLSGLIFGVTLLLFGLLYSPIFKKITKNIPAFKNLYVSLFFASLVFFPIIYYSYKISIAAIILSVLVFLKSFIMQIFLDIKDIKNDKQEKLRTIPVLIGKEKTFTVLKISSSCIAIFLAIFFSLIFLLIIPFNLYCFRQAQKNKYSGYILASSEFTLWSILILFGKIIL